MGIADDAELLRLDAGPAGRAAARVVDAGSSAFLGRVATSSPAVGTFMKVVPRLLTGSEQEGQAGTRTDLDAAVPILAYLVGPGVPAQGDDVVCRLVDYRWAARKRGGTSPPPPPPPVTCPVTIHVTGCLPSGASGAISGADVSLSLAGTTVAAGTTDASGYFSASVPGTSAGPNSQSYTVSISLAGYQPYSGTISTSCYVGHSAGYTLEVTLVRLDVAVVVTASRCDYWFSSPNATNDGSGTVVTFADGVSGTTGPDATVTLQVPTADFPVTWTASGPAPYYGTASGSLGAPTPGACELSLVVSPPLEPGYTCCAFNAEDSTVPSRPIPTVINATIAGSTLQLTLNSTPGVAPCRWTGCAQIKGIACNVTVTGYDPTLGTPAQLQLGFISSDYLDQRGGIWVQGTCGAAKTVPACQPDGSLCPSGGSPTNDGFAGYLTLTTSLVMPAQPGWDAFTASGSFDGQGNLGAGYPPGCPFQGPVTTSE